MAVDRSLEGEIGGCCRSTEVTIVVSAASWRVGFFDRRVDPDGSGQIRRLGPALHEALGMGGVGGGEHLLSMCAHRGGVTEVHDGGREEADPTVSMVVVVPTEEDLPEGTPIFEGSEALGKLWTVLERSELGF